MEEKSSYKQIGNTSLAALLVIAIAVLGATSFIPVTRHYNSGKEQNVLGITTAASSPVQILQEDGKQLLVQGITGVVSQYSITQTNNNITVNTPDGTKVIQVLPTQALKNMNGSQVMSDIISPDLNGAFASINQLLILKEQDGVLGYQVDGVKKSSLFGLLPVKTNVTAFVSAENGQVVQTQQSLLSHLINKLSF